MYTLHICAAKKEHTSELWNNKMMNVPSNSSRNVVMSNETEKYIKAKENTYYIQWPEKSDEKRQKSEAGKQQR